MPPPHLGVHLSERRPQFVGLPSEDDGLRAGVQRGHLHGDARGLQDLLQGVALWTDDVLVLGLLHLHGDGGSLPLLRGRTGDFKQGANGGGETASDTRRTNGRTGTGSELWLPKLNNTNNIGSDFHTMHQITLTFSSCPTVKSNFLSAPSPARPSRSLSIRPLDLSLCPAHFCRCAWGGKKKKKNNTNGALWRSAEFTAAGLWILCNACVASCLQHLEGGGTNTRSECSRAGETRLVGLTPRSA